MRILHIIDYFQPKLGYQETFLAREHARLGHEVYVVTSDRYNPIVYSGDAARGILGERVVGSGFFEEEGVRVWRLKTLFELGDVVWALGLEKKVRELGPDLVVMHGIASFSAVRIARLKKASGSFKLIHDDHMLPALSTGRGRLLYPVFRWAFSGLIQKTADALVAVTEGTREFMHTSYGIPPERVHIIPLGADDELFRYDEGARRAMRASLGLAEDDVVFAYTGKIVPQKRVELLLDAVSALRTQHGRVKVLMVGDGSSSYLQGLKEYSGSGNLRHAVVWHESVPNDSLCPMYCAADAAVWPNGPSIGMREAMACNLPIIMNEQSGVTELVAYDNGFLCQDGNVAGLVEQMKALLDPTVRQEMGLRSRKLVEDRFNWRVIAQRFLDLV